jgi:2-dehydropantoate 2-reductase
LVVIVAELPDLLLIGNGRLASHLKRYFEQLHLRHVVWSKCLEAHKLCRRVDALVHARTPVLLAISDGAIEPFVQSHPELAKTVRVHFSGRLASPLAVGAHPLFSFAGTFYERELYERIRFVVDHGSPPVATLIPGLLNPSFFIEPGQRERRALRSGGKSMRSSECRANRPCLIWNQSRAGLRERVPRFPVP